MGSDGKIKETKLTIRAGQLLNSFYVEIVDEDGKEVWSKTGADLQELKKEAREHKYNYSSIDEVADMPEGFSLGEIMRMGEPDFCEVNDRTTYD